MSDTDSLAKFAELLDKKIDKLEKSSAELLDKKIDKLENTLIEKVTLAVSDKVCETVTKKVDDQIEVALAPLLEKQEKTDSTISELREQISGLVGSIKNQPNNVFAPVNFPTLSTNLVPPPTLPKPLNFMDGTDDDTAGKAAIVNIVSNARCVVGIAPVTPAHVDEQGAPSHEEGLLKAALDYLRKD